MTREQLKERVRKLPMQPGVYMHKDKTGKVIYRGIVHDIRIFLLYCLRRIRVIAGERL